MACLNQPLCRVVISAYVLLISCLACYPATCSSESAVRVTSPTGNSGDRMALLTFKTSLTRDPSGALASWNDTLPLCRWRGVRCGRRHPDRVTELRLRSFGLSGPMSTSLANLTFLRRLDLSNNSFRRHIPAELGRLSRLRDLNLSMNSLAGKIPTTLANCSRLETINLMDNVLVGVVPPSFGSLSSLKLLSLARNRLGGYMSPWLAGNLTSLTVLDLTTNSLIGAIPSTVGALISLRFFLVAENNLQGTIPSSLYNLSSLVILNLGDNRRLSGTLPSDMGVSLPNLEDLSLYKNQFHGSIPSSLPNASALEMIQLSHNNFSGVIPSRLGTLDRLTRLLLSSNQLETRDDHDLSFLITSLTNCTRLQSLELMDNNLEGVLPSTISNLSKSIVSFAIGKNRISGSIPEGIGSLTGLTRLGLGDCLLEGTIPPAIGKLHNLVVLFMPRNQLSGQIPSSMSNLTRLNVCFLKSNRLQGVIPPSLVNLQKLQILSLSNNKLSGSIPKELFSISSLSIALDLSNNSLSGVLPTEVGKMTDLNAMGISDNNLSGEIPGTLGDCEHLVYLRMRGNTFNGIIPQSFSKLRGLEDLDLSRNNLTGGIPDFLQNFLSLEYLNLSFNDFDGAVPKGGIFQNASAISVMGNHRLCGGILELRLSACSPRARNIGRRHRHIPWKTVIIVSSTVGICLVALFLYLIFSHCLRGKAHHPKAPAHEMLQRVSYSELFKATEGFSSNNLIGVGSFGSVYRANMDVTEPNGGQLVAVKVINLQRRGALKSFMAECEALRNIRHRNLLKILTSCSSIDFSGNDFKALVFEFMPRGSLEQWLHPSESENGMNQYFLNLTQRLSIAVDVASALTYLHQYNYEPIVHCDLKPSNILLDNDMIAHVSDFGLARFLTKDDSRNPSSSLVLRGSIGYIAPEYGMLCKASTEGDVFSYGVLLLEMVTGRKPTDASFGNDLTLHKFVDMAFPEHVLGIVDPDLLREEDGTTTDDTMPSLNDVKQERKICLVSMARLGLMCSKESPKERMQMEDVTKEITAIRHAFLVN